MKVPRPAVGIGFKLVLDAIIFSPVAIAGYFTLRSVLEGKTLEQVKIKVQKRWSEVCIFMC